LLLGVQMADDTELELGPGDVKVLPPGHDAWVIGDETAVAIDWGRRTHLGKAHELTPAGSGNPPCAGGYPERRV
jgi:hypothetical protein